MFCRNVVVFGLFAALFGTNAHVLSTTPTPTTNFSITNTQRAAITSPALTPQHYDLYRRGQYEDRICGYAIGAQNNSWICNDRDYRCTNTIIWIQQSYNAYLYCSPPGVAIVPPEDITTTAVSSWDVNQPCGLSTKCWYVTHKLYHLQYLISLQFCEQTVGIDELLRQVKLHSDRLPLRRQTTLDCQLSPSAKSTRPICIRRGARAT